MKQTIILLALLTVGCSQPTPKNAIGVGIAVIIAYSIGLVYILGWPKDKKERRDSK